MSSELMYRLLIEISPALYRRLMKKVNAEREKTGKRVTRIKVIRDALNSYL
jgi:hypothetical protein